MTHDTPSPAVSTAAFEAQLAAEGFGAPEVREIAPGTHNDGHSHPFEVKALMLAGELQLTVDGHATTYRTGDVFTMAAGCEHIEQFGADTTRYLVGRKQPA